MELTTQTFTGEGGILRGVGITFACVIVFS